MKFSTFPHLSLNFFVSLFILFSKTYQTSTFKNAFSDQIEIYIASDHRGYSLKDFLVKNAANLFPEFRIHDLGPYDESPTDYTLKSYNVVSSLTNNLSAFGVLICMDGIGMEIAGNYFAFPQKIFAANCRTIEDAVTAREHNAARILAIGSQLSYPTAAEMIRSFVITKFLGNEDPVLYERHLKRLKNITDFSDSVMKKIPFTNFSSKKSQDMNPHRSIHNKYVQKMKHDLLKQFSHSWQRAEDLIMPMTHLSQPDGPYACSCAKKLDLNSKWRPHRDEVGETKVMSFRSAIISFWTRVLGIQDHDRHENEQPLLRLPENVSIFQNLFVEKVQPFLIRHWNIDVSSMNNQTEINDYFLEKLNEKYARAINFLKSSFGSNIFFGHYSNNKGDIERLEAIHLPYIAFIAEEVLYPITSYTDHGFLCYAYLNQRHVLSLDPDGTIYQAHMQLTLAIHRAMILLQLANIHKFGKFIPEAKQCSRFIYRTLTLPTGQESFDPLQLKFALQHTSFSTHPIGALSVFQTVWCVRLREEPELARTIIVSPSDDRLSLVSGISKHPSEFEAMVPTFSEFIIPADPNLISDNHLGWTALIDAFKKVVLHGNEEVFKNLMEQCDLVAEVIDDEYVCDDERLWKRRNSRQYSESVKCMYDVLSREASIDGTGLISRFIPEMKTFDSLKLKTISFDNNSSYNSLINLFKNLSVDGSEGSKISYWDNLRSQFESALNSSPDLQKRLSTSYQNDTEKFLLEYSISLCTELWWFGFKFVDDQIQRQDLFEKPASLIPKYFYAVIFSFGIVIPNDIYEDFIINETLKVSLEDITIAPNASTPLKSMKIIAEGSTSVIGMDEDGYVWKLFKEFVECPEVNCPCDKRKNAAAALHEQEISAVLTSHNSQEDSEFVNRHFVEILESGQSKFSILNDPHRYVPYIKMKYATGSSFSKFITDFFGSFDDTNQCNSQVLSNFIDSLKNLTQQGLEILEFLKKKNIVQMDFHEGNAIVQEDEIVENANSDGSRKLNLVLIDFGLAECYDPQVHEKKLALLRDKSYMPTTGKGRLPVSDMFLKDENRNPLPPFVHDLQIFSVRFIENAIFGMSSKIPHIFNQRKLIKLYHTSFGKYMSFVKDIFDSKLDNKPSFLESIATNLISQLTRVETKEEEKEKSKVLLKCFSYKLYQNMKVTLKILQEPSLSGFLENWLKTYFIDNPTKISIQNFNDFPTSSKLLKTFSLKLNASDENTPLLGMIVNSVENFIGKVEDAFKILKRKYAEHLDVEPELSVKIDRIVSQLLTIRMKEIKNATRGLVRSDPFPRAYVSCQGSYNPPTKAHLFLAHEGRKRALEIYAKTHPEGYHKGIVECNESNVFGILSTIATFEVMEKDYPNQCFTVEERQGFLRYLSGTKMMEYKSGDSPYDKYNDWSWLLLDYSGHSGGAVKNSSEFLAESETINIIFLIAFANFVEDRKSGIFTGIAHDSTVLTLRSDTADKLKSLRIKYGDFEREFVIASQKLLASENSIFKDLAVSRNVGLNNFSFEDSFGFSARNTMFLNSSHFQYIEQVFHDILVNSERIENKGNSRLYAISGESKNSNNKGLYLGMANSCPRNFNIQGDSFLQVSSTKIREYMYSGLNSEMTDFIDASLASRLNNLMSVFKFVEKFYPDNENLKQKSEHVAQFFKRNYEDAKKEIVQAAPIFNTKFPIQNSIFRNSYLPLPVICKKLDLFIEFADPSQVLESPILITGVFNFEWNKEDYPFGNLNIYNLLRLEGKRNFIELLEVNILESNLSVNYAVTEDEIIFEDSFIRAALEKQASFRIALKCKILPVAQNKSGRGLYLSGKNKNEHIILTLMEPFGFSNLFYMQDRPDIQVLYDVIFMNYSRKFTMYSAGDAKTILLSDYLKKERIDVSEISLKDQNVLLISDEHPKPTYLFQLIFYPYENELQLKEHGKLIEFQDSEVNIRIMKDSCSELDDTSFGLASVRKTMDFDREYFGLEYDSLNLNLVAANDFNSGAREMRNFMVFSPSKLLSNRYISTLDDFYNVERIVAHEFLHHFSGNRVTMRDFFEVTLKEGLTVLRDMYFRESKGLYGACSRIEAVTKLRRTQWVQDSGPKAHSVRPNFIESKTDFEVSLFTPTVYEKGAEIMRMIQVMIDPDMRKFAFMIGQYLSGPIHHSNIDELVSFLFMQSRLNTLVNKDIFMKWFTVKGTPVLSADWNKDQNGNWKLELSQSTSNGNDSSIVDDLLIPIQISLFSVNSNEEITDYTVILDSGIELIRSGLFLLKVRKASLTFRINNTKSLDYEDNIIPSINRFFNAPIKVDYKYKYQAHFIAKYETDIISRFDAFQHLIKTSIFSIYRGESIESYLNNIVDLTRSRLQNITNLNEESIWTLLIKSRILLDESREQEKLELALSLEEIYLSNLVEDFDTSRGEYVDPVKLSDARETFRNSLSQALFGQASLIDSYDWNIFTTELDPFKYPGSVKLEQVILRSYLNSKEIARSLSDETDDPSMERQIALLECQYRLSENPGAKFNLLSNFNDFFRLKAKGHAVAKEKLFKFMILKSTTASELKEAIEKFALLNETQPQSLKLFAKEFASNNLAVFHSVEGLKLMGDVIMKCDSFGNHETAATLIKHSFEVNLLNLDMPSRMRVLEQLNSMRSISTISPKLEGAIKSLSKKLCK